MTTVLSLSLLCVAIGYVVGYVLFGREVTVIRWDDPRRRRSDRGPLLPFLRDVLVVALVVFLIAAASITGYGGKPL